jgi:hypothetical protein
MSDATPIQDVKKPPDMQIARLEMRMRPAYRKDGNWGDWKKCPEHRYAAIQKLEQHPDGHYMENKSWHYDLRVLWVDVNNPRG